MNANDIQETAEDVRSRAQETADALKDKAGEWQDNAVEFAKRTDAYVRENVWTSIGVTAILAFAIGVLISRSRD